MEGKEGDSEKRLLAVPEVIGIATKQIRQNVTCEGWGLSPQRLDHSMTRKLPPSSGATICLS